MGTCILIDSLVDVEWIKKTKLKIQSNLSTTATLGTPNLWPLLTGGRCSEVVYCCKDLSWDSKMAVVEGRWSLFGGGH